MNKIEDIKSICKNPHIVQKGGMSITEIALALGITYQQAKSSLETGLYKVGTLINTLKEDDSIEIINIHGKGYKLITPEVES